MLRKFFTRSLASRRESREAPFFGPSPFPFFGRIAHEIVMNIVKSVGCIVENAPGLLGASDNWRDCPKDSRRVDLPP